MRTRSHVGWRPVQLLTAFTVLLWLGGVRCARGEPTGIEAHRPAASVIVRAEADDHGLKWIAGERWVRHVMLDLRETPTRITDEGIASLAENESIRTLVLRTGYDPPMLGPDGDAGMPVARDGEFVPLPGAPPDPFRISDATLAGIARMPRLERLTLDCGSLPAQSLRHLRRLTSLRLLQLSPPISPEQIEHIAAIGSLGTLSLHAAPGGSTSLELLRLLTDLRSLTVRADGRADDWLLKLGRLDQLWHLAVTGSELSERGAAVVGSMRSLSHLQLSDGSLSGDGLRRLLRSSSLVSAQLVRMGLTDDDFMDLEPAEQLRRLDLSGNGLSDRFLEVFNVGPALRRILLLETGVTPEAAAVFSEGHPSVSIGLQE